MTPHICLVGLQNLPVLAPEFAGLRAGGAELQQTLLAKALVRKGFRVSMVVADLGQADGTRWHGVTTYRTYRPDAGPRFVRFVHPRWTQVWDAMRRADADVYYTSCAGMLVGQVAMFTRRHRKKLVFRIASSADCDPRDVMLKFPHEKVLYRYGLARADLVLAQTAAQAEALRRNYGRSSRVVPPLADVSAVRRDFRDRDIDVLWVGNLRRLKRAELLLEAARELPDLSFHIVGGALPGSESYYAEIADRASALPNVTFHGLVPYHEMQRYYERARVHAATSQIEGFPNTYLQAWAHGVPVVAFLDPENLVERNGLGRIVSSAAELRDAIALFARDAQHWNPASARCARYVDDAFDEDRTIAPYVDALTAADAPARCGSVLMVGTHPSTKGGIRMLVEGYRNHGLFRRAPVKFIATHWERSRLQKALIAIAGWCRVGWALVRLDRPLVHVHLSSQASFWRKAVICVMARLARRPYLLHVHGGRFMRFHEESGPRSRWFIRRIFARAALVLALTEEWRTRLSKICPEARIEVLPNGVPLPVLAARESAQTPRVLFLGVLHPAKGTFDLVRAFGRIAPRFPEWKLVCAGSGAIEATEALAAELGIADRVECPGWLDARAKQAALAEAMVFALPSYAEGLPMALLEGMSWGLPAIATPVGGIPGTIHPPYNGLLVPPGDIDALAGALLELMGSHERRATLGRAARATIEREFSLDASIERLLRIYSRFGIVTS